MFRNAEGEVLGTVPLRRAFVLSCNTAFINLASVLDPSDFAAAGAQFGLGVGYDLGTASYSGQRPDAGRTGLEGGHRLRPGPDPGQPASVRR